jgi:hypothetical protein
MSIVELNAVTGVGQYLGDETFELQQFFLGHVMILVKDRVNRRALCRLPLWPIEAPSIAPSFHEPFGCWLDIPS